MSREIKFRGKRNSDNKWVYGYFLINSQGRACIYDPEIGDMPVIPETVGQYTGLKDKNGKEIYEEDILKDDCSEIGIVRFGKLPLDKSGDCVCTYLAYYVECKGKLGQAPSWECQDIGDWMEVIGNIHEHPELIKETK